MAKLVFVHGWGSGPFVWNEMINDFSEHDIHFVNMGFINDENFNIPQGEFIGIGHSLGGMWLLKNHPNQLKKFISVASFNCFYKYIPQSILSSMQSNIVKDTGKQLIDFWHHAGLDHPEGFKNLNPVKLIEGLTWLSQWDQEIPKGLPVLALASRDDKIVPEGMSIKCWENHKLIWSDDGGHMLPLTKSGWCTKHIKEFIDE